MGMRRWLVLPLPHRRGSVGWIVFCMTSAQSSIANVYAVFGADAFRKRETIAELCARIAAESGDGQGADHVRRVGRGTG
jgi:hypothetical protein